MKGRPARFRLVKHLVTKSSIEAKEGDPGVISILFSRDYVENKAERLLELHLETKITSGNDLVNINISIVGFFEFDNDIPPGLKDSFFKVNASAILFPYVRAYVSALTALSGISPILLPTLHISA
jgi:preprotein translocase subunit SecB